MDSTLILTGDYDYLSDSDLEDGPSHSGRRKRDFKMTTAEIGGRDSTHNHLKPITPTTHRRTRRRSRQPRFRTMIGLPFFLAPLPLWLTRITAPAMTS